MQQQEFRKLAAELKNNLARLMDKRSTWESHWQECADFMQPRKAEINKERQRGDKRNIQILMLRLFTHQNYLQLLYTECLRHLRIDGFNYVTKKIY